MALPLSHKFFSRLEPIPGVRLPKVVYAMNRTYASLGQEPEIFPWGFMAVMGPMTNWDGERL